MRTVGNIQEFTEGDITNFRGHLCCLIYLTAHKDFREVVKENWEALDISSGEKTLVMVADTSSRKATSPPSGMHVTEWITTNNMFGGQNVNQISERSRQHFGLRRSDLPCIVFFDKFKDPELHVYSFHGSKDIFYDLNCILDDCQESWHEPSLAELEDVAQYRRNMLDALRPKIRRRKVVDFMGKHSGNGVIGSVITALVSFLAPG